MQIKKKLALLLSAAMLVTNINVTSLSVQAANTGNGDATTPATASTTLSLHIHGDWTYEASGATLTAKCFDYTNCHKSVSLTLSASDANYSGTAYTGASLDGKEAWESTIGTAPTIKYVGRDGTTYAESATAPTAVGKYTAKITFDTNKTATANFEITKASQTAPTTGEGYTIDYTAETITAGVAYEVSTSNTTLTPPAGGKVTPGTTYYVRKKGNDNNAPSAWTAISVPARPATPADLGSVMTSGAGNSDGKITGVSDAMEYSTDGTAWTVVSGTEITGLAAGTYKVRVKATATTFASESTDLTVVNPHAHSVGTKHDAVPGNCVDKGTLEYYDCTDTTCTKKLDKDGNELASIEGTIDATKHKSTETTWTKTATNHKETYKCCGAIKTAEANHSGGTATCQAEAVCSVCQDSYGEKADHNYKYSASANVLTVACQTTGCDKKITLTLTASSANYSGSAATITVGTTTEQGAWTGAGLTVPTTISYAKADGTALTAAPTTVGSYTASVTIGTATASVSYTIEQAHEANTTKYSHDDTNHWRPCVVTGCTNAEHKYSTAAHSYDSTSHECVCGKIDPNYHQHEKGTHHAAVAATCNSTGNVEYWDCTGDCGDKLDTSGNAIADVTLAIDASNHSGTATWTKTATTHKQTYNCCGAVVVAEANHVSSGAATETKAETCTVCGYEIAPKLTPSTPSNDTPAATPTYTPDTTTATAVTVAKTNEVINITPSVKGNDFSAVLDGTNLKDAITLTPFEKAAGVWVWAEVDDVSATVSPADVQVIAANVKDATIGAYINIVLFKQVPGQKKTQITNTAAPVKLTITVPANIAAADREYAIVRVHDGVFEQIIDFTQMKAGNLVEFTSDKFSTYAIIYKDATAPVKAPKTGDTNAWFYMVMLLGAGLVLVGASRRKAIK